MEKVNKKYKDRVFKFIFGRNKAWALSLYNAVNGSNYTDPDALEFNTIDEILYRKFGAKPLALAFIRTAKGQVYLCVIIDLFARKVIAWSVSSSQNTKFVAELLLRAWKLRRNPKSVIFHSDRGTQYTSNVFRQLIDELGFRQSLSAPGCPYDNAVVEAFFKFLKQEEINRRKFSKIEDVKQSVFSYIEGYYNKKRPHSANSGLSPDEKEAEFWKKKK